MKKAGGFLDAIKALNKSRDSSDDDASSSSSSVEALPVSESTKAYLQGELKEVLNEFSRDIVSKIDRLSEREAAAYKIVLDSLSVKINRVQDTGFSEDDKSKFFGIVSILSKNIDNIIKSKNIVPNKDKKDSPDEQRRKEDKAKSDIKKSKEQIDSIPSEVDAAIKSIVERKGGVAERSQKDSVFSRMLAKAQDEVDRKLYEQGDFDLEQDVKRFEPLDIKKMTKKIENLDVNTSTNALQGALKCSNIHLAHELIKKMILSEEFIDVSSVYFQLLDESLGLINRDDVDKDNDPRIKFFKNQYQQIVNQIEDRRVLELIKSKFDIVPKYLEEAIKARLSDLPKEYSLKDLNVNDIINPDHAVPADFKVKCLELMQLQKDLRIEGDQEFADRTLVNNIYKYCYAKENGAVSENQLQREASSLITVNNTATEVVAGGESKTVDKKKLKEEIKAEIKTILGELGVKDQALEDAELFKVIAKRWSSLGSGNVLDSSDDKEGRNAEGSSFSEKSRKAGALTAQNTPFGGIKLKPTKGGNDWHVAAKSTKPKAAFERVQIGWNQIDTSDNSGNAIHALFSNNNASPNEILEAAEWLFDGYKHKQGEGALADLLNVTNSNGDTALHLLCNNRKIENEALLSLLKLLEQNGADLSAKNAHDQTALHLLCNRLGSLEAVQYLTDRIDINAQDIGRFTPLYVAVLNHQYDLVNHLISKSADTELKQTANKGIPETVQEYFNKLAPHGTNISTALQKREVLFKCLETDIGENKIENLQAALKANSVMIHERDEHGNSLLHVAVKNDRLDIIKHLIANGASLYLENGEGETPLDIVNTKNQVRVMLNASDEVANYRLAMEKDLAKKESSYAGSVAGAGSVLLGALSVREVIDIGKVIGPTVVAADFVTAATAVSGAAVWGAGRLGYECWHQYKDGADANIREGYVLQSNFAKTWKELEKIEVGSKVEGVRADYLKDLESKIVEETKKQSPNIVEMGKNLVQADILRKSLFKGLDEKDSLIEKSEELIKHFNKWREVQKGRDMSEGMNVFCDVLKTMAVAAGTATVSAFMTNNGKVVATAAGAAAAGSLLVNNAPIVAAADTISGAIKEGSNWVKRVSTSMKIGKTSSLS